VFSKEVFNKKTTVLDTALSSKSFNKIWESPWHSSKKKH